MMRQVVRRVALLAFAPVVAMAQASGLILALSEGFDTNTQVAFLAGVDEAKRMIMERFGITATQANTLLTKLSQDSNTPVTDIAANIVISGSVLSIVG